MKQIVYNTFISLFMWMDASEVEELHNTLCEDVERDIVETADKDGWNDSDVRIAIKRVLFKRLGMDGIMANINKGANNGRDKKVFLLDRSTFPDALTFSESDLEAMVASGNYFDDDIVKIDANGYDSVKEAIKNEWCNFSEDLEDVLKDWYVIPFGF